ncbi:MAG: capsular biosynthesis protein [Proteobacteria bacterium]|nr:capsular biosynthesis protein [Pseudomonadota bacterium]
MSEDRKQNGRATRRRRGGGLALRFALLVLAPFLVAAFYLGGVASDRYVSQAHFTVRDSGAQASAGGIDLGGLLGGIGGGGRQDAYLLRDYILSADLLAVLDEAQGLRAAWSDPAIDPLWRLAADASDEDFLDYYRSMIAATIDTESGIMTVELQGFTPEPTRATLRMILAESETLVNEISNRLAREQLDFINGEIDDNSRRLRAAKAALLGFQNEYGVVDPNEEAGLVFAVIAQMEVSLAEDKAELSALRGYLGNNAHEVVALRNRIAAKAAQVRAQKKRLTGGGDDERLNRVMARFEELRFGLEFANERYRLALLALEGAQIEASRKVKSLVIISRPNLPDEALYPDRSYILATAAAFLLMGFAIFSVILAAIREHME